MMVLCCSFNSAKQNVLANMLVAIVLPGNLPFEYLSIMLKRSTEKYSLHTHTLVTLVCN